MSFTLEFRKLSRGNCVAAMLVASFTSCDTSAPAPEPAERRSQQLAQNPGDVVLDDGLSGERDPAPERGDGFRSITLNEAPEELELIGARVFDARHVKNGVVTVGVDHVLRLHTEDGARELDTDIIPPISVAAGRIAYAKGYPPDIRLTIYDLNTNKRSNLLPELMPVWSPALSADGREVIFAASPNGSPELLRLGADGQVRAVESAGRTPSSPFAPVWNGQYLDFEDEFGSARLDVESGTIEVLGGAR